MTCTLLLKMINSDNALIEFCSEKMERLWMVMVFTILMTHSSSMAQWNNSSESVLVGKRFNCSAASEHNLHSSQSVIMQNEWLNIQCESVALPQTYQVRLVEYFGERVINFLISDGIGDVDVCTKVRKWEELIGTTCSQVLCEQSKLDEFFSNATRQMLWIGSTIVIIVQIQRLNNMKSPLGGCVIQRIQTSNH